MGLEILVTTSHFDYNHPDLTALKKLGLNVRPNPFGRRLTEDEVYQLLHQGTVVGMVAGLEPLTRRVLESAHALKVISRCGVGFDNVALDTAKELGVDVYTTYDAPTQAVSELTLALILNLLRKINYTDQLIKTKTWQPQMGYLLAGKTVGIIGFGRIGTRVSQLCRVFDCHVLGYDPNKTSTKEMKLVGLDQLLQESDIISLHFPYCPDYYHFIDAEKINCMKPGAYLINVSRGGLIDEAALFSALKSGRLAGAALDVYEQEPYEGPLIELPEVVLTPHVGSYALEARMKMEQEAILNLKKGLIKRGVIQAGQPPGPPH